MMPCESFVAFYERKTCLHHISYDISLKGVFNAIRKNNIDMGEWLNKQVSTFYHIFYCPMISFYL